MNYFKSIMLTAFALFALAACDTDDLKPAMTPLTEDMAPEAPCPADAQRPGAPRRSTPGSNAFVPSVAGLIIAGEVVKDLVGFVPMKG